MGKLTPAFCLPSCRHLPEGHPHVNALGRVAARLGPQGSASASGFVLPDLHGLLKVHLRRRGHREEGATCTRLHGTDSDAPVIRPQLWAVTSPLPSSPVFLIGKTSYLTCPRGATAGGQGPTEQTHEEPLRIYIIR